MVSNGGISCNVSFDGHICSFDKARDSSVWFDAVFTCRRVKMVIPQNLFPIGPLDVLRFLNTLFGQSH